jgi:hypothetical protein
MLVSFFSCCLDGHRSILNKIITIIMPIIHVINEEVTRWNGVLVRKLRVFGTVKDFQ